MEDDLLLQRLTHIGDRWQGLIGDIHRIQPILGQVAAFGHDDRHRLAHVADSVPSPGDIAETAPDPAMGTI